MSEQINSTAGPLVNIRGLTKTYQEGDRQRVVFCELDASVEREEIIVLLGRSGSGKSTLLNLISGIDLPTAGSVTVDDVVLSALSETERTLFRRRNIGFVFQFFNLIHTLTVEENLLLPLELNGALDETGRAFAHELLLAVSLADRAESYPDRLSGGEQQRVAIARALVHKPLLLLADEPTGNLDRDTGQQTLKLLQRLTRDARATLIMVSHSSEAAGLADRVFNIEHDRLIRLPGLERRGA
ncbi:MAG: ABC transporter ATP-binding protein [Gammaproteobacteria bacterium]|nr:ABC transporter ATP-binding protein [Gammaproteobacteria bacterium]